MSLILGWFTGLAGSLLTTALGWLAKLIGKEIKAAVVDAADSRENQSIEKEIENAKTIEEKQAALNHAAQHMGDRP